MNKITQYSEQEIKDMLSKHVCRVIFIKKNNVSREMICTSNWIWLSREDVSDYVGFHPSKDSSHPKKEWKPGQICVYDLDLEDWRSFYANKVTHIEIYQNLEEEIVD